MRLNPYSLKEWRNERGMTISGLSDAAKVLQPSLSRMEKGQEQPGLAALQRIAVVLAVDPRSLVGPTEDIDLVDWPFVRGKKRKVAA